MARQIDARGLSCPHPVVLTKNAIEAGEKELVVLVDNETAVGNVSRFAAGTGFQVSKEQIGSDYKLALTKSGVESKSEPMATKNSLIFINSNSLGQGSEELGQLLIKTFLHTLNESAELPDKIVFMNSGVKLVTEGSESIEDLKGLVDKGVELLACGTCLDYFSLKEKIAVGNVSNMYEILSSFLQADKVITI